MHITYLGVGSAFDQLHTNTSMLLSTNKTTMLLDCGYAVHHQLFKQKSNVHKSPMELDAIWISHQHCDHLGSLLWVLTHLSLEGRTKELTIIGQPVLKAQMMQLETIFDPLRFEKMNYLVHWLDTKNEVVFNDCKLSFAPTDHPVPCSAIRIDDGKKVFCYSGDGMFTTESEELYKNADLLVHEGFMEDEIKSGHASIKDVLAMAIRAKVKNVSLVHLDAVLRKNDITKLRSKYKNSIPHVSFPNDSEQIQVT